MSLRLWLVWLNLDVLELIIVIAVTLHFFPHDPNGLWIFGLIVMITSLVLYEANIVISNCLLNIENKQKLVWGNLW